MKKNQVSPEELKERRRQYSANYRAEHPELCRAYERRYRETHREQCHARNNKWSRDNNDRRREKSLKRREERQRLNPDPYYRPFIGDRPLSPEERKRRRAAKCARWSANNKGRIKELIALRRARLLNATPIWVDLDAMRKIYRDCPDGMHVDHIIPLRGIGVSGLHIPINLQYLTPTENRKKSNKVLIIQ